MSDKIIKIGGQTFKMIEFETAVSERSLYGLNVYIVWNVNCAIWEYLMPAGTLRDERNRDMNTICRAFIRGIDKGMLLNEFVRKLNVETGLQFHVASDDNVPQSVCEHLALYGLRFDGDDLSLIVYGNNK